MHYRENYGAEICNKKWLKQFVGLSIPIYSYAKDRKDAGRIETYQVSGISENASFLEMLDVMNEQLIIGGDEPVAFDHDCKN